MPRTGTFGGFSFDSEVFSDYMSEQPTWNDRILASGILVQDQTIMDLIGTKGNVATLPFYVPIDEDESHLGTGWRYFKIYPSGVVAWRNA